MTVTVTFEAGRVDVVLERPEVHNAMNWDLWDGLADAAGQIAAEPSARVAVFSGAGPSFSSGIDTTMFGEMAGDPPAMVERAQACYRAIEALEIPTVAKVHGHALGAGLQLALVCDLRVVATDADLGLLEIRYGLVPDLGGTARLPALVGPAVAKKMMWLGERVDGARAERIGLAEIAAPAAQLDEVTDSLAAALAAAPPIAVAAIKRLVDEAPRSSFTESMDDVGAAQLRIFSSSDLVEAMAAFAERRSPVYRGT